jgi:hypothetical protein
MVEQRCPFRFRRDTRSGCCTWDTFLTGYADAWERWFDAPPSAQQWRMARADWDAGNTGWEAAHNAQRRIKERVAKREHEAWAASGAVITFAKVAKTADLHQIANSPFKG